MLTWQNASSWQLSAVTGCAQRGQRCLLLFMMMMMMIMLLLLMVFMIVWEELLLQQCGLVQQMLHKMLLEVQLQRLTGSARRFKSSNGSRRGQQEVAEQRQREGGCKQRHISRNSCRQQQSGSSSSSGSSSCSSSRPGLRQSNRGSGTTVVAVGSLNWMIKEVNTEPACLSLPAALIGAALVRGAFWLPVLPSERCSSAADWWKQDKEPELLVWTADGLLHHQHPAVLGHPAACHNCRICFGSS
jgi:hypothetical protein